MKAEFSFVLNYFSFQRQKRQSFTPEKIEEHFLIGVVKK